MRLARQFNILACAAVLSAILSYCVADSKPLLGLLAIVTCGVGFWAANEGRSLPRLLINALVLIAIADAAAGATRHGGSIVSDLSRFLVYIQLIKLFDRRTPRDDAHLLSLSVFIVIGAILTSNILGVGLFLLAYTPLAISAAMLLQLTGGQRSALAVRPPGYASEASVPALGRAYRRSFRRTASFAVAGTVALAVVAFMVTPRGTGRNLMGGFGKVGSGAVVGFVDQIRLGSSGLISDSETPVLDVKVSSDDGQDAGNMLGLIYLRAYAKDHYDRSSRTWEQLTNSGQEFAPRPPPPTSAPPQAPPEDPGIVSGEPALHPQGIPSHGPGPSDSRRSGFREQITLRKNNTGGYLFTTWRTLRVDTPGAVLAPQAPDYAIRDRGMKDGDGQLSYVVHWVLDYTDPEAPSRRTVSFESERVGALAREILSARGITLPERPRSAPQNRAAANALQGYLRQNCSYTLEMFGPEHGEDPIEMFLFRTRKGHCEYFASALVALCQSVGIDARIVAGYLASEYSDGTGQYIVRESNAHAWAEVELEPGRWVTMDPSPPDVIARLHRPTGGILGRLRHLYEAMEFTWVNAVVTFDEKKRSELVGSGDSWSRTLTRIFSGLAQGGPHLLSAQSERAIEWFLFGAVLIGFAVWVGWRRVRDRRRELRAGGGSAAEDPALAALLTQAGFYERAMRSLEDAGLGKPRHRPPLLHAGVVGATNGELAGALASLASLYYRVRFARSPLSEPEAAAAEALADRVAAIISGGPGGAAV